MKAPAIYNPISDIVREAGSLSPEKRDELVKLLECVSLANIVDTIIEIRNRLLFLNGLEQIIYNTDLHAGFKERQHLHKIIAQETWLFGDQYTYGADDITLKNVLKTYLTDALGRTDFQELLDSRNNEALQTIPDVCLWHQYNLGSAGKENLVIELKKPGLNAGLREKNQIESYAARVAADPRFPKDQTRWKFILVTKDITSELEPLLHQTNRNYGHISQMGNCDVFILTWGRIIADAKIRLEFVKAKLNMDPIDNRQGIDYIVNKYKQYLPDRFAK